ncbi:MAG: hypothetical protein FWE63_00200 [Bacteroidales bacterium]|nr:hypothetical protein [Bacteroidales bacterium]
MKKIILSAVMAAMVSFATAQEIVIVEVEEVTVLTNKKGTPIFPTAGAWAFSIDASPFFTYVGGIFSNAHAPAPIFTDGGTFSAKYFLKDDCALRFKVSINRRTDRIVNWVPELNASGQPHADNQVKDVFRESETDIMLMVGLQKIVGGKTRLVGFYGAEAGIMYGSYRNRNTFGNDLSAANNNYGQWRTLKDTRALFGLGAGVFAGVEYFIAPGISIGGEVGWAAMWGTTTRGKLEEERWDNSAVQTETNKGNYAFRGSFLGHFNSGITLTFYF